MKKHSSPAAQPRKRGAVEAETSAMVALFESRQWDRLEAAARRMTATHPGNPFGWKALGLAFMGKGMLPEAARVTAHALKLAPGDVDSHNNLGNLLADTGRLDEAVASYRRALAIRPDFATARYRLGDVLNRLGLHAEAETCFRNVLARQPDHAGACRGMGDVLKDVGRMDEAELFYRRAIALRPEDAGTHQNLGNVLMLLGRAGEAETSLRRALALDPDNAEAHANLGSILNELGRHAEAKASCRQALAIDADHAGAHLNLGNVFQELGRLPEAEACYRRALALRPDYADAHNNLLFSLNYQIKPPEQCLAEAREYGRLATAKARERFSSWFCQERPERLRVGIVSGDLRNHPVGHFLESVLAGIEPTLIELHGYPSVTNEDGLTHRLRRHFTGWRPLAGLGDEAAARLIRADGIHILLDLSGHTAYNRLPVFAWKPAPVQASWLGYFATTGLAEMDWFLADETGVPPEHRHHFTEKVWYLPETRLCFTPPDTEEAVSPLPALRRGHVCFGSFHRLSKINVEVLRLWGRVLASCPGSRLRLQDHSMADAQTATALRERMAAQGIDPGRLELHGAMPRREYLAAHAEVDILLDTFPFTGGTTTCEALWMGVPTLTLAGETLIARQGASLLTAAELSDWIAADDDEYVAKAVAFASDLEALAGLRAGLREQVLASPLFDAPRFARHLEDALWGMWEDRGLSGGTPVGVSPTRSSGKG